MYSLARQEADPGPDGIRGNGDDGAPFTVFDIPTGVTLPASIDRLETPDENRESYKTVELMLNKRMSNRWSLMVAAHHLWAQDTVSGKIENPNEALYNEYDFTNWAFKVAGTYQGPWDVVVTPLVRHQSGDPLRRLVPVSLRSGTFDYTGEGFGKYRVDNPTIVDVRLEKRFQVLSGHRLGVFFDGFNLTNSNAAEAMDDVTGRRTTTLPSGERVEFAQFMRPTAILNPRVYRFGVKYRLLTHAQSRSRLGIGFAFFTVVASEHATRRGNLSRPRARNRSMAGNRAAPRMLDPHTYPDSRGPLHVVHRPAVVFDDKRGAAQRQSILRQRDAQGDCEIAGPTTQLVVRRCGLSATPFRPRSPASHHVEPFDRLERANQHRRR